MNYPDEWTQKEYLINKKKLEADGIKVILIDTILSPIEKADTVVYSPPILKQEEDGTKETTRV